MTNKNEADVVKTFQSRSFQSSNKPTYTLDQSSWARNNLSRLWKIKFRSARDKQDTQSNYQSVRHHMVRNYACAPWDKLLLINEELPINLLVTKRILGSKLQLPNNADLYIN